MLARICRFIFRQPEGDENNVEKIQQYRQGPHSLGCQVTHHQRFCLLCDAFRVPHSSLPAHQMISIFCWSRLPFIVADMPFSLRPTHGVRAVAVSIPLVSPKRDVAMGCRLQPKRSNLYVIDMGCACRAFYYEFNSMRDHIGMTLT